jgi:hypothetical protein
VIAELGGPQMRLFTIGVGDDVKQGFLTGLAADHGGRSRFVTTEADLETELRRLFDDFSLPVLTATTLSFDGTRVFDLHPADASVLGAGRELFQVGRYTTGGSVKVRLAGALQEEVVGLDYEAYLAETGAAMSVIHRLWAYEKVQALERQVRGGGDRELSDDILSLGLEYRLVTSRTSLFAPDDEVVVDPEPEQTDFGSATAVSEEEAATRTWLGRTFRWQDGLWVDVRARAEMPVVVVHRLEELPETLRPYAALGRRLRIVDEGRLYELTETALPAGPVLLPNAPNPFNPYTVISFVVPVDLGETTATLGIYDVAGRLVWHSTMAIVPGEHSVVWDARDRDGRSVASGVYLIRLQIGDHHATRRATLVR